MLSYRGLVSCISRNIMFYFKYFIRFVFYMIITFIEHRYIYPFCNEIDYLVDGKKAEKISKQIEDEREEVM